MILRIFRIEAICRRIRYFSFSLSNEIFFLTKFLQMDANDGPRAHDNILKDVILWFAFFCRYSCCLTCMAETWDFELVAMMRLGEGFIQNISADGSSAQEIILQILQCRRRPFVSSKWLSIVPIDYDRQCPCFPEKKILPTDHYCFPTRSWH